MPARKPLLVSVRSSHRPADQVSAAYRGAGCMSSSRTKRPTPIHKRHWWPRRSTDDCDRKLPRRGARGTAARLTSVHGACAVAGVASVSWPPRQRTRSGSQHGIAGNTLDAGGATSIWTRTWRRAIRSRPCPPIAIGAGHDALPVQRGRYWVAAGSSGWLRIGAGWLGAGFCGHKAGSVVFVRPTGEVDYRGGECGSLLCGVVRTSARQSLVGCRW